jgi:hypothetical protein
MRHEMLTQCAFLRIAVMAKGIMQSQHFVTHVIPPASRNADSVCPFVYWRDGKRIMPSQHFVTHVIPHVSRNANSVCPFFVSPWWQKWWQKGYAESAFRDACHTSSGYDHNTMWSLHYCCVSKNFAVCLFPSGLQVIRQLRHFPLIDSLCSGHEWISPSLMGAGRCRLTHT